MKQLYNHTKFILALLGAYFFIGSTFGQTHTEYLLSTSYVKSSMNPALRPQNGYIGIPGLTNFSLGYRTNTFILENFLFPGKGEDGKTALFLHKDVDYKQFMKGVSKQNFLDLDFNATLLGFGFYAGDAFLTFDASLRANAEMTIPKTFFDFMKNLALDENGKDYNLAGVSADATAFGQIGVGGSYPFFDNTLLVGAKVKVLLGLANARLKMDRMKLHIGKDNWSAMEMQTSIQVAMKGLKAKYNEAEGKFEGFDADKVAVDVNGFGFGFDVGASFNPSYFMEDETSFLNNFTVSAAVTDLGFINWNKANNLCLVTNPNETVVIMGDRAISTDGSEEVFSDFGDAFKDVYNFTDIPPKEQQNRNTGLKAKLNWGIEYAFPEEHINVGLVSTTAFNWGKTVSEYTVGGAIKPIEAVEAGLSYSFVYGGFQTFGLSLHLGSFFYIASDYILPETNSSFIPVSSKAFNVQMGFVVPIGRQ
ncbi:MAG: DUF5723 family protein [Dysgonamonadaceae bacterium]|jgi:hypothetical protein|nr:DUF5723 family protein [Dysgonamonadaceae bacterium]